MKTTRTYRTEFAIYAMWLGLLGLPLITTSMDLAKFGWTQFIDKGLLTPTLLFLGLEIAAYLWLSRYRLTFDADGISYRSWRTSWSVPYTGIAEISASRVSPVAKHPVGAYVLFKDGRRELVYTKVFPKAATEDLFALADDS